MKNRFLLLALFFFTFKFSDAQHWNSTYPFAGLAANTVDILKPGYIVSGGGKQANSTDYGTTWNEDANDGYASWNKSIAFADTLNGLGAGYQGRIISTNDGGVTWGNAVFPVNRNFNKIVNVSPLVYYTVGGINDSIQTIIKTGDGGATWNIIRDTSGPGFNAVFFINPLTGFVVGDSGMILGTGNGGNSWNRITSPVLRNFDGIAFINADTGYIAGGFSAATSTRTILQTVNGGTTWIVLEDQQGSCLHDISFADASHGYIVGDSAAFLQTNNGGQSWGPSAVSGASGLEYFTAVKFYTPYFGVVSSSDGFVFVYTNLPAPSIQNEQVIFNPGNSLSLNAGVNTYNQPDTWNFIYSTNPQLNNPSSTIYTAVNSSSPQLISADVSALLDTPGTYYFTCLVSNPDSTYSGDTLSFIVPAITPQLITIPGSGITSNSITLRGQVSNLLRPSALYFEYQNVYDTSVITVPATPGLVSDTLYHVVLAGIAGLLPYTPYRFRLKAISGNTVMYGNYIQFSTTPGITVVTTLPATDISATSATLEGQIGYLPFTASVSFQYSLFGSSITQTITATPSFISDTAFYFPSADVNGLSPNSYYLYRLVASDSVHTIYGDYSYFYNGGTEFISADSASAVTETSATLYGHVSNIHFPANLSFYYAPANSSGTTVSATPAFIFDTLAHTVSAAISGLQPFTQYNYALSAQNAPLQLQSVNPVSFYTGPGYHNTLILSTSLNGFESDLPDTASVFFDFWQSGYNSQSIAAAPATINDTLMHQFTAPINGLNANTVYLYRIKITGAFGTIYGDSISFYNGPNTIPNFDFETWTSENAERLPDWNIFGPGQRISPGANGSNYAVRLQNAAPRMLSILTNAVQSGSESDVLSLGLTYLDGGWAYNGRPDTFSGMFEYNLVTGDTAYVFIKFKSAGHVISQQFLPVSGNNSTGFTQLKFPIQYNSAAIPDTVIMAFVPTYVYGNFPVYGSWMAIDSISFGSAYPPIPNGNFENWNSFIRKSLDGWIYDQVDYGNTTYPDSECVDQITPAWHGNYAAEISNISVGGVLITREGDMSTAQALGPSHPDFAVNHRPVMLSGYYKFFPVNGDTLEIQYSLFKNGVNVGGGAFFTTQPVSNYTLFTCNAVYSSDFSGVPDSAYIDINTCPDVSKGNSRAIIDYLAFDGFTPADTLVNLIATIKETKLNIYPNPAGDYFTIEYTGASGYKDYIKLYDICGKEIYENEINSNPGVTTKEVDVSKFEAGIYLVSLQSGTAVTTQKLVIQR